MLFSFLSDRRCSTYRNYFLLLVVFVILFTGMVAKMGCSHQEDMAWDTVILLESAYRLHTGQMPHVDYLSPIGIFPSWLFAMGMKISHSNTNAIGYAGAMGFIFVTLLAWFISARRLPGFFAFLLSLLLGTLLIATRPLAFGVLEYNFEFSHTSYSMWYNRLGWALLSLLALQSFLTPKSRVGSRISDDVESFIAGVLVSLLMLTKVNYTAAALGISLIGFLVIRADLRRIIFSVAGLLLIPVFLLAFTSFSIPAWLGDFVTLGRLVDMHYRWLRMTELLFSNLFPILSVGVLLLLLKPFCDSFGKLLVICGTCVGIGLVVLNMNMQMHEVPLFAVACAIILETARRNWESGAVSESLLPIFRLCFLAGTGIYLLLTGWTFASDTGSVLYSFAYKNHMRYSTPENGIIQSKNLGSLLMPPRPGESVEQEKVEQDILGRRYYSPFMVGRVSFTSYQYAHLVNDGLALIKPHVTPATRVFCVDLANPFPFALSLPYPKGGITWWAPNTFNKKIFPKPEQVFEEVTHVLIPKYGLGHSTGLILEVYKPYLMEHFEPLAESKLWDLYVRKNPAQPLVK